MFTVERYSAAVHQTQLVEIITDVWVSRNEIAKALGVGAAEYRQHAIRVCDSAAGRGDARRGSRCLSTVAVDDHGRIVAFHLCYEVNDIVSPAEFARSISTRTPAMRAWGIFKRTVALLCSEQLDAVRPLLHLSTSPDIVLADIGGVIPGVLSSGIFSSMTFPFFAEVIEGVAMKGVPAVIYSVATHPSTIRSTRVHDFGEVVPRLGCVRRLALKSSESCTAAGVAATAAAATAADEDSPMSRWHCTTHVVQDAPFANIKGYHLRIPIVISKVLGSLHPGFSSYPASVDMTPIAYVSIYVADPQDAVPRL